MQVLLICVALDGYEYRYQPQIESQRAYAARMGYQFWLVNRPLFSCMGKECAWLKLYLLQFALMHLPFDLILSIDADAEIKETCPRLESVLHNEKTIYLARGYSGRFNSGVILCKKEPTLVALISDILAHADKPVPAEDSVGWGENGHIIHWCKTFSGTAELDRKWNNNQDPHLTDYIRHYSNGPLYRLYQPSRFNLWQYYWVNVMARCASYFKRIIAPATIKEQHLWLFNRVMQKPLNIKKASRS